MDIATAIASLKTAFDLSKALMDVKDATVFQTKAFELTREILAAQQSAIGALAEHQKLAEENRELKEQISRMDTWTVEKKRYALTEHGGKTFTRTLIAEMSDGEPIHRICAQCYEQGRKGFLQSHGIFHGRDKVECLACGKVIMVGLGVPASARTHP